MWLVPIYASPFVIRQEEELLQLLALYSSDQCPGLGWMWTISCLMWIVPTYASLFVNVMNLWWRQPLFSWNVYIICVLYNRCLDVLIYLCSLSGFCLVWLARPNLVSVLLCWQNLGLQVSSTVKNWRENAVAIVWLSLTDFMMSVLFH